MKSSSSGMTPEPSKSSVEAPPHENSIISPRKGVVSNNSITSPKNKSIGRPPVDDRAKGGASSAKVEAHKIGKPMQAEKSMAEDTFDSNDPFFGGGGQAAAGQETNPQMHFLNNMHHATHWLSQHELDRSKTPLRKRLNAIQCGHYLPLLAEVSASRLSGHSSENSRMNAQNSEAFSRTPSLISKTTPEQSKHQLRQPEAASAPSTRTEIDQNQDLDEDQQGMVPLNASENRGHVLSEKDYEDQLDSYVENSAEQRIWNVQVEQFWAEIDEVTVMLCPDAIEQYLPAGFVIPNCKCGTRCNIVRFSDADAGTHDHIWVCANKNCMYWELYECVDNCGNPINKSDPRMHSIPSGLQHTLEAHALNYSKSDMGDSQFRDKSPPTGKNATIVKQDVPGYGELTLEQFWAMVEENSNK